MVPCPHGAVPQINYTMGFFSKLFGASETLPEVKSDIRVYTGILDRSSDVNDVFIAGLEHHCTRKDRGFFAGFVFNENDNPYDKKAMAVADPGKKMILGYVPGKVLSEYRKWCKDKCVCVGYIFYDGEHLRGRIRAYHPDCDKEKMVKDATEYARQVCEHFHWETPTFNWE